MPDFDAMAAGVVKAAQEFVGRSIAAVVVRLAALEQRLADLPAPRDGQPGAPGAPGQPGKDGAPGVDGLGFDDIRVEYDGERYFAVRFFREGCVKEFEFVLPLLLDRGVWREERAYARGDGVTWGGSFWIAQRDTTAKPDGGGGDFRLAVKKGRDAK